MFPHTRPLDVGQAQSNSSRSTVAGVAVTNQSLTSTGRGRGRGTWYCTGRAPHEIMFLTKLESG